MARETKIGLLVGMGFIVCFAIILSKRGGDHPSSPRRAYPTLSTASQTPSTPGTAEQRARDFGRNPRSDSNPNAATPRPEPTVAEPPVVTPPAPTGPALATHDTQPPPTELDRSLANLLAGMQAEADELIVPQTEPAPMLKSPVERNHVTEENHTLAAIPPVAHSEGAPLPDGGALPPPARTRPYVVEKGDTLTRIAQKCYGTSSKDIVDAIFEANRKTLPGPDRLVIGQTLQLPERIGNMAAGDKPRNPPAEAQDRAPEKAPAAKPRQDNLRKLEPPGKSKGYRWYEVRKGDRYESIAKRELGDARRWKEVYELNKKVFPKASDIRWGVRIKLPEK